MSKIGYLQLTAEEQQLYRFIEQAFGRYAASIQAPGIGGSVDPMKVLQVVLGDHPQVIYFSKTQIETAFSREGQRIRLFNVIPADRARFMARELSRAVQDAVSAVYAKAPTTLYEKLMGISEYLQDRVVYDHSVLDAGTEPKYFAAHNAYGALVNGRAVCDGIAAAFALIADRLGIECTVVCGRAARKVESTVEDHAWNIVRIGADYYHVDVTWDLNRKAVMGDYSYDYLCVPDASIRRDHTWNPSTAPPCRRGDMTYYVTHHCLAQSETQLDEILTRYAKSRSRVIRVQLGDGFGVRASEERYIGERLMQVIMEVRRRTFDSSSPDEWSNVSLQYTWNADNRSFYAVIG